MGSNTATLETYGPHYWLDNGWDGSVVLGNGTHYPILVTMMCDVNPPQPPVPGCLEIINYLVSHYHVKPNGVHLAGLSEGAFTWSGMISFENTPGDEAGMKPVTSVVLLSGAATSTPGKWAIFGHWAKKYHGKAFLTVGYADAQVTNPPLLEQGMNDSVRGSAYFTYNNLGGGSHCCWNTEYDPNFHSWQSFSPYGTYVTTNTDSNSRGTYTQGSSIFQWMLRQGDTTLVGSTSTPAKSGTPVANAGADPTITLPVNSVALSGTGSETGGTIASYNWSYYSGPSTYTISNPNIANPVVSNLVAGTYIFKFTVTDVLGAIASALDTINVNPAVGTSAPTGTALVIPGTVQAESYASMSNVQVETTGDAGGGQDVGYIYQGSWMQYSVNVAAAGAYTVSFRVSSVDAGASFVLQDANGNTLTTIQVPVTGNYQTYTTVMSSPVTLAAGVQNLKIVSTAASHWNINWMQFASVAALAIPGTVQAESYASMSNVQAEATGDVGGGQDVGYIYQGSWMQYPVNVASAGAYTVSFRVSSVNAGASFVLQDGNGNTLTTIQVPVTGNYQTYTTVTASGTVTLAAGAQNLKIVSTSATNWNINWMQFTQAASAPAGYLAIPGTIQAVNYVSSVGVIPQATSDLGGGQNVGWIYQGDWMQYNVYVAAAGTYTASFRVATPNSGCSLAVRDGNGNTYASLAIPNTGGWQTYATVTVSVTLPAGAQSLRIVSTAPNLWNFHWMQFASAVTSAGNVQAAAVSGMGVELTDSAQTAGGPAGLQLWPNPATDHVTLTINNDYQGRYQVFVFGASGSIQRALSFEKNGQVSQELLSLGNLPPGVYFVRVQSTGMLWIGKILKL